LGSEEGEVGVVEKLVKIDQVDQKIKKTQRFGAFLAADLLRRISRDLRGEIMNASRRAQIRALRAAKQRRYRALKANGQVVIEPKVDPVGLAEFLHEAGVRVDYCDRETLARGVEVLLAEWEEGRIRVTRARGSL